MNPDKNTNTLEGIFRGNHFFQPLVHLSVHVGSHLPGVPWFTGLYWVHGNTECTLCTQVHLMRSFYSYELPNFMSHTLFETI